LQRIPFSGERHKMIIYVIRAFHLEEPKVMWHRVDEVPGSICPQLQGVVVVVQTAYPGEGVERHAVAQLVVEVKVLLVVVLVGLLPLHHPHQVPQIHQKTRERCEECILMGY
jgi:hypothetical protein